MPETAIVIPDISTDINVREVIRTAASMDAYTSHLVISSDIEKANASEMLARVAKMRKALEERRVYYTKPLLEHKKRIDDLFKRWTVPLEEIDRKIRQAITNYNAVVEEERRKKEELERKKRELLEEIAAEEGRELPPPAPVEPLPIPKTVRTSSGTVASRMVWDFEVEDEALVPREYLAVDTAKIRAAVRAGVREIPGVKIFQREELMVR